MRRLCSWKPASPLTSLAVAAGATPLSITIAQGRTLIHRRRIALVDGRIMVFFTNDSTGSLRQDDGGVFRYYHRDGQCANFRRADIKTFVAIAE